MTIPSLANSPTKEKIIELLSQEWPLTAKKIYHKVSKRISITYQATHKALQELVEKRIIEKSKEGYQISKEWIKNLGDFSNKIENELEDIHQKKEINTMQRLHFEKHDDFIKFQFELMGKTIEEEGKADMVFLVRHVPFPNAITRNQIEMLKKVKDRLKWKMVSKTWTPLDELYANFWKKIGVKVENNPSIPNTFTIIINDYILDVYKIPYIKAIKEWDEAYEQTDLSKVDFAKMNEMFADKKFKYIVTVLEDKELANILND